VLITRQPTCPPTKGISSRSPSRLPSRSSTLGLGRRVQEMPPPPCIMRSFMSRKLPRLILPTTVSTLRLTSRVTGVIKWFPFVHLEFVSWTRGSVRSVQTASSRHNCLNFSRIGASLVSSRFYGLVLVVSKFKYLSYAAIFSDTSLSFVHGTPRSSFHQPGAPRGWKGLSSTSSLSGGTFSHCRS
jgi:hypothetical protein